MNTELGNLLRLGLLKREAFSQSEFDTTVHGGSERLQDARAKSLAQSSSFVLAYGAAYAFALAALRRHGFRPANRYVVFQCLPHTLGVDTALWRTLARAHDVRNGFEYEGSDEITADLTSEVIRCAERLLALLGAQGRPPPDQLP